MRIVVDSDALFAVLASKREHDSPLYLQGLTFGRLIDEVVVPYETKTAFFIDGVPVTRADLTRLKIVQQGPEFAERFRDLHYFLQRGGSNARVTAEDYPMKLAALFRGSGVDVTVQVLNAYEAEIGDRLKDYLANRPQLIEAAAKVFFETIRLLS